MYFWVRSLKVYLEVLSVDHNVFKKLEIHNKRSICLGIQFYKCYGQVQLTGFIFLGVQQKRSQIMISLEIGYFSCSSEVFVKRNKLCFKGINVKHDCN